MTKCTCVNKPGDEYYCEVHGGDSPDHKYYSPNRPATRIEIEAMGAICDLQDRHREAKLIIMALLDISSPDTWPERWEQWSDVKQRAIEFLKGN